MISAEYIELGTILTGNLAKVMKWKRQNELSFCYVGRGIKKITQMIAAPNRSTVFRCARLTVTVRLSEAKLH